MQRAAQPSGRHAGRRQPHQHAVSPPTQSQQQKQRQRNARPDRHTTGLGGNAQRVKPLIGAAQVAGQFELQIRPEQAAQNRRGALAQPGLELRAAQRGNFSGGLIAFYRQQLGAFNLRVQHGAGFVQLCAQGGDISRFFLPGRQRPQLIEPGLHTGELRLQRSGSGISLRACTQHQYAQVGQARDIFGRVVEDFLRTVNLRTRSVQRRVNVVGLRLRARRRQQKKPRQQQASDAV